MTLVVCPSTGKTAYGSKAAASKTRASLGRGPTRRRGELQIYRCGICNLWHYGHRTRRAA